jgi:hypothetical protein
MTDEHHPPALDAHDSIQGGFSVPAFDPAEYAEFFEDDDDLTDEQKHELLEIIWNIVVIFVDLGFGIEATQQALASALLPESNETSGDRGGSE